MVNFTLMPVLFCTMSKYTFHYFLTQWLNLYHNPSDLNLVANFTHRHCWVCVEFDIQEYFLVSGWISSSVTQFYTAEVQPGQEVTLKCSNISRYRSHIFWFKMASSPNASCISAMSSSDSNVSFCDGFKKSKFHMTSNTSVLFLEIKQVNSSDSALYFCGEKQTDGKTIILSGTYLKVQGK